MNHEILRQKTLTDQILSILFDRINSGEYTSQNQLPSENQLADEFGVSRATIRRVMDIMESRGEIQRRQGVGAFIRNPSKITRSLDRVFLLQKLIEDHGYKSGIIFVESLVISSDDKLCEELNISRGEKILRLKKIFLADDKPVIYLCNSFPSSILTDKLLEDVQSHPELSEPIFNFLLTNCHQNLKYFVTSLSVDTMKNCPIQTPDTYPFNPDEVALVIDEVAFSVTDKPVMHTLFYYPGNIIKFNLIRKAVYIPLKEEDKELT
jgi:GntR family transcriptional regulator